MSRTPVKKDVNHVTYRRTAARLHRCGSCQRGIHRGEVYLSGTVFPGHDSAIADTVRHPVRLAECGSCARRYGRAELLEAGR